MYNNPERIVTDSPNQEAVWKAGTPSHQRSKYSTLQKVIFENQTISKA